MFPFLPLTNVTMMLSLSTVPLQKSAGLQFQAKKRKSLPGMHCSCNNSKSMALGNDEGVKEVKNPSLLADRDGQIIGLPTQKMALSQTDFKASAPRKAAKM
ncbi:unnamed protein product [Ixodes pacificus]